MLPLPLGGHHVLVAHEHQGPVVGLAFPIEEQVPVDLGLFQLFVHQGEELLQQTVEAQKLLSLILPLAGDGFAAHHAGEGLGVARLPLRVRGGLPEGLLRRAQQGAQQGDEQQQKAQAQKTQQYVQCDHACASFAALSRRK